MDRAPYERNVAAFDGLDYDTLLRFFSVRPVAATAIWLSNRTGWCATGAPPDYHVM